ncbi:MAG: ankyrin repeat domain-containing protein, partial [Gammaproteobacteria bacterium]|nr:ankyrin repeat domain-containing protein [Gammaproteobacteria bacterium]
MQARTDLKRFIAKMREKHELPEIGKINPMILIGVSPHDDQTDANNVLARKIFFDAPVPDNLRNLSLDAFEPHGRTPLMLAVQQENLRWVEALLKAGANPNLIDKTGKNALHLAAAGSDARILQLLLNSRNLNSASLSMADESGKTPDESGKTPFDYAEQENRYSQGMMLFPARPKKPETRFVQEVRALFIKERRKLPDLNQAINQAFSDDTLDSNTILSLSTYLMLAELVGDDQEKLKRIQSALDTPKKRALYEDAKRIYQTISATLAPNSSQKRTPLSEIPSLETLLNLRHVINTTLDKYKKTEGNSYKLLEFFRDTVSFMIACHTYPDSLLTRPAIELIKNSIDELVDASDKWRSPNHRFASINSLLAQAFREKAGLPDRPLTKADAPALKKALWTGEWEEDLHRTPLMNAASTGNWGAVNQILERAFNDGTLEATLKATDILGNTALHLAQNQSVARVLLSYSSSFELIEQQNLKGKIPTESAGVQAMGLLFPMKEKQLSIEPLTEASSPIETFRFRLNQAINEYEKKHTDHQERHSYKAAIQLLSYLDRMIALRRDTTEGANPPELIELERQGLERKIAHLVMQSGQHHSHVGADSLVTFLANAYGHYLPLNMFGRVLPSKEDMTKGLTLLAQGPQGPDDVVEHTEAVLRALQSSTTDPKEATKNPCSTLSKETVEKLLKHFVQHLWMGGKTKGDYRVLNNLLRNDQLLEASIDTEERQRNLLNFIITAYQDNPSSMGRDQLKKDFYEELGKGNLTQEKALKIAAILERWNLPFPTADKASRAEYHTTNRSQVVDQLLPLRLESENWSHIARRFNHLISIDPAARLGGVAAWFYFSLAQESRYEGETSMIRYRAIVNPIAYINSQAKATCTWTYQELISNPKLHEAVVELDRLWQQHRTQILKTLRPDDDFVAEPYGYQDLPDDSPEMQELNRFHRLEDMIQTLIYENPEHIKKLPRDFRVCAELLRGPKTGNPQIPFHGLNLKRVEAIELAVLLMKQLPDPAPERDAAEEKAEGTAAPRFTEGEIRLAQGIQTLAAHSGSSSAGLTALKERLLILKDPTPRQVIDCFLGTAIERKYMARQDNAPTPDTKMAGASANPEANEEAAVASQDQSTREKLQAKATEFLRNKTLQELYDLIEQIHSDTANQNSLITQFLEKVYSYSEDAKKHRPDDYIPLLNEYRNDRVVKNWHERSTEEGTTRMVQSLDSMPLAVSRGEKLSPYQIWTYINQISWIPPLTDFIAATLINATDVMNEQLRKKGGHAFSKNDLQLDIIRKLYSTPDCPPRSLLCILAQQGNVAALKIILDISVQIQRQEKDDLEMLTTSGGILSQLTNDDDTNIFHHVNDVETFELLLKKIHYQRISKLLDTQATIKTSDGSQTEVLSPLGLAVSKGNVEVVKAMLRAGADPAQVKVPISTDRTSPEWEIAKELIKANLPPST